MPSLCTAPFKLALDLTHQRQYRPAQDTEIGNERVRGVSGGERKRTNLGVELISDPSVIFLDEPTSGLDSFQAESVIQTLKKLACNGRTVFTSIHQPSSQIFAHFDQLLLLSEGQGIYFGPANEAVSYFAGLGHRCPKLFNPADFFLDLLSVDYRSPEVYIRPAECACRVPRRPPVPPKTPPISARVRFAQFSELLTATGAQSHDSNGRTSRSCLQAERAGTKSDAGELKNCGNAIGTSQEARGKAQGADRADALAARPARRGCAIGARAGNRRGGGAK
jgi:hypothetical protein